MLHWKLLHKIMGTLLILEASLLALCLVISLFYGEDDSIPFLVSGAVTAVAGVSCRLYGRNADNELNRKDAYMLVTSAWVVFTMFGMLPFLIGGYIDNVTDAMFETISGFTTTGASILNDVECLPHGILFWRTMTQWIGGLGIVFFTIAVLPSLAGSGSVKVFSAETTGPIRTKMHPRLSTNSHTIWITYIILTAACAFCYYIGGMSFFDCINYSMTTCATGGFATHNTSTEFFNSPAIEYTGAVFCFLSGINFTLLYMTCMKLRIKDFLQNTEMRLYSFITLFGTAIIMYYLITGLGYDLEKAFRCAVFQTVSFLTSTGLFSDDAGQWPHVTWIVLGVCMFIGGCAGSTAGGVKCIRIVMVLKYIANEFKQILHPNAVLPVRINNTSIPQSARNRLLPFLFLYLGLFLICATYFTAIGVDVINSITLCLSCLSNVGPTLGVEIGPTMSWAELPVDCKWFCAVMMLIGRLEIFSVLILFTPEFWKNN